MMKKQEHRTIRVKDFKVGMVVLPFCGVTFQIDDKDLDWSPTLMRPWWQCLITHVTPEKVVVARLYGRAAETSQQPLQSFERMEYRKEYDQPFLLLSEGHF